MLRALIVTVRPKQWVKNLILFAPLVFSKKFMEPDGLLAVGLATGVFCLLTGSVYLLNDLFDLEKDRRHPLKKMRPLPSGQLALKAAWTAQIVMSAGALGLAYLLNPGFAAFAGLYFVNNLAYSTRLKHVVIVDVMSIALGFVLRVLAGAVVISVPVTPWLLMCTVLLALFLGFAKRRHELELLEAGAQEHRKVLEHYTPYFLDQMIIIVAAATVMSYALYTIWPDTVAHFGTANLIYTVPFVLYGLFRYLYLVHVKDGGGNPTHAFLTDKPLLANILLWLIACVAIISGAI